MMMTCDRETETSSAWVTVPRDGGITQMGRTQMGCRLCESWPGAPRPIC